MDRNKELRGKIQFLSHEVEGYRELYNSTNNPMMLVCLAERQIKVLDLSSRLKGITDDKDFSELKDFFSS